MIEIVPAALVPTLSELADTLKLLSGTARSVQIDVVDGTFAPNRTWPYAGKGEQLAEFQEIVSGTKGLPHWQEFDFEIDLMVRNAKQDALDWVRAGASSVVIHAQSADARETLEALQDHRQGEFSVRLGVGFSSSGLPKDLQTFGSLYDFVQVMGIARPGFQGEIFDTRALSTVRAVRERYPAVFIQVDGGVTKENARSLALAGANRLIVGHDVLRAADPAEEVRLLTRIAGGVE